MFHSHGSEVLGSLTWLGPCQLYTFPQDFMSSPHITSGPCATERTLGPLLGRDSELGSILDGWGISNTDQYLISNAYIIRYVFCFRKHWRFILECNHLLTVLCFLQGQNQYGSSPGHRAGEEHNASHITRWQ